MSSYVTKYEFVGQDSADSGVVRSCFRSASSSFKWVLLDGKSSGSRLRFPSRSTHLKHFPVGLSYYAPYNDVCADLERLHSGFSAVPRPIPVILHGNQSILMIQP